MKKLIIIGLIIALLVPSLVTAQEEGKYAVIVSYDGYRNSRIHASTCARLLKDVLADNGYRQRDIVFLSGKKATKKNVAESINSLKEADEVVIAFFGHGGANGIGLRDSCLFHAELKNMLSGLEAEKQLVIIDTCGSAGAIIAGDDGIVLNETNRIVLTSTVLEIETSVFRGHLTNWSRAVLKWGLKDGNADFNGDGRVSIEEAGSVKGLISDGYEGEFFL